MRKRGCLEFFDNDVYYLEAIEEFIVINDNYEGIILLDNNLKVIEKITLIDDVSIYTSYSNLYNLLLFCPDNDCLIFVNVENKWKQTISLAGYEEFIIKSVERWDKNSAILLDYEGNAIEINIVEGKVKEISTLENYFGCVKEIWKKENNCGNDSNSEYMINVSETRAIISYKETEEKISPKSGFEFLRGRIISTEENTLFCILSTNKENAKNSIIELFEIS